MGAFGTAGCTLVDTVRNTQGDFFSPAHNDSNQGPSRHGKVLRFALLFKYAAGYGVPMMYNGVWDMSTGVLWSMKFFSVPFSEE